MPASAGPGAASAAVLKGEWGAEDMGRDLEGLGKAVQNLCAESGGEQEA